MIILIYNYFYHKMVIREKEARADNRKTKAPELNWVETGLVDEEEEYRTFGGYLPAEVHSRLIPISKQRGNLLDKRLEVHAE